LIGKKLKELREDLGLKQLDIANELGVSRSTYTQYETGKSQPDLNTVSRLADYFEVSTDYLLNKTDVPTPYRGANSDLDATPDFDTELKELLKDEDELLALKDFSSMSDESKKEIIQFIKFKKEQEDNKE